jgi:AcrR family transcriptional regulator
MKLKNSTHAKSEPRKRQIIEAALDCFTEKGFTDASIAEICRRANASTGSVYHHFSSKEQLAAAVYLEGIKDYQAGFMEELERHKDAREGIMAIICFYLKWVEQHPDWSRFLFQKRYEEFMGERKEELNRLNSTFFKRTSVWFKKQIEAGTIRRIPGDLYPSLLMGPCMLYSQHYINGDVFTGIKQAADLLGQAAWLAIAAQPGQSSGGNKCRKRKSHEND